MNLYDKDRDVIALGQFYTDHISAMTREGLHAKSDIAAELAYRDQRIAALEAEKAEYEREKLKRESQEPVAFRWLGPGKGWRAVYAEPPVSRELEARIRELEAEKAHNSRMTRDYTPEDEALDVLSKLVSAKTLPVTIRRKHYEVPIPVHLHIVALRDHIAALEAEKAERDAQEPVAWVLFDDIFIAPKDMQDDPPNLECMKPLYAHPLALREPTEDECSRIAIEAGHRLKTEAARIAIGRAMWQAVREVMTK